MSALDISFKLDVFFLNILVMVCDYEFLEIA